MNHSLVVLHRSQLLAAADATPEREGRLAQVRASGRVGHTQWAVHAAAVLSDWVACHLMAPIAEVGRAKAVEHGHRAAVVALPVDLLTAMLLAVAAAGAVGLHLAVLAAQVLFLCALLCLELLLAVHHAAEVRALAVVALIEGARVHGEVKQLAFEAVTGRRETLIRVKALLLSHVEGHPLDPLLQLPERG